MALQNMDQVQRRFIIQWFETFVEVGCCFLSSLLPFRLLLTPAARVAIKKPGCTSHRRFHRPWEFKLDAPPTKNNTCWTRLISGYMLEVLQLWILPFSDYQTLDYRNTISEVGLHENVSRYVSVRLSFFTCRLL